MAGARGKKVDALIRRVRQVGGYLYPEWELVALGILAFRGAGPDAIANHIRRAFRHGVTRAEVLAALEATIIPGGAVTFLNGIRGLARVQQEARGGK